MATGDSNFTNVVASGTMTAGTGLVNGGITVNFLEGSETYDAGSIDDGNEEVGELTITGAALGDYCQASITVDVADLAITAAVTAADTVTYQLNNNTGGAIDLASATVSVLVTQTS